MNILILPSLCIPSLGSEVLFSRNLADLFQMESIRAAICADEKSSFRGISFYPAKAPGSFSKEHYGRSYEEYQKACGALGFTYLKQDYDAICSAAERFEADLLIEISRPAAFAAGKARGIPVCSVISAPMFREAAFPYPILSGLNEFLRSKDMEQVVRLNDLFRQSEARICLGPQSFQPIPPPYFPFRFGFPAILPLSPAKTSRLSIVFGEPSLSTQKTRKIICAAFQGAPYEVHAYMRNTPMERRDNIRFQNRFLLSALNGSSVCIHDGNETIMLYCLALGIPQVIVHDGSYQRSWNAACGRRAGIGRSLAEENFSMERLYETYRAVLACDDYEIRSRALRDETMRLGDLSAFSGILPAEPLSL